MHTDFHVAGISKVMAFDFIMEYKKGSENKATNALSRKPDVELLVISLLTPNESLYAQIKTSWRDDPMLQELIARLQTQPYKAYTWINNQLRWKGRLVVGTDQQLRKTIITLWRSDTQRGHSRMDATIKRLQSLFHWKSLITDVRDFYQQV